MYNKIFLDIHLVYLDDPSFVPLCECTTPFVRCGSSFTCPNSRLEGECVRCGAEGAAAVGFKACDEPVS